MNKKELIAKVTEKLAEVTEARVTKKATEEMITVFVDVVTEALAAGETVKIPDFGTFSVTERAERTGIIQFGDKKGETYTTPAHRKPSFKPASVLKEAVR